MKRHIWLAFVASALGFFVDLYDIIILSIVRTKSLIALGISESELLEKGVVPDVVSYYYARSSLRQLWRMYSQYGYFKPLVAWKVGRICTLRQMVPLLCLALLLGLSAASTVFQPSQFILMLLVGCYALADFAVSFAVGLSSGLRCAGWLMLVFPTLHVSYGIGYVRGIFDFWIRRKFPDVDANSIPLSR